jgi:hypothetical protein
MWKRKKGGVKRARGYWRGKYDQSTLHVCMEVS